MDKPKNLLRETSSGIILMVGLLLVILLLLKGYPLLCIAFVLPIFGLVAFYDYHRLDKRNVALGDLSELLTKKKIPYEFKRFRYYSSEAISGKHNGIEYVVATTSIRAALTKHYGLFSLKALPSSFHGFSSGIHRWVYLFECYTDLNTPLKAEIARPPGFGLGSLTGHQKHFDFDVRSENTGAAKEFIERNQLSLNELIDDIDSIVFIHKGFFFYSRKYLNAEQLFRKLELMFEISRKEGSG